MFTRSHFLPAVEYVLMRSGKLMSGIFTPIGCLLQLGYGHSLHMRVGAEARIPIKGG